MCQSQGRLPEVLHSRALWKHVLPGPGGRMTSTMGQAPEEERRAQLRTVKEALGRWPDTEADTHASREHYH